MPLFHQNKPNHSLLLMPVRLGNERWPKNKVRLLSCDAEGNLFTQLVGRSTYQRIRKETQYMEVSQNNYATIYWDTGASRPMPLVVKIEENESWALNRILEHALRDTVIPDVLRRYPEEIIKLGDSKRRELSIEKTRDTHKTTSSTSSKVLNRLPYYRKDDVEVSIPIYKVEYAFPLIVLKQLPPAKNTLSSQQRLLVLDSDGDLTVTTLPLELIDKAERKRIRLQRRGKEGYLICLQKPKGISVDIMEMSELQRLALENVTQYFEETSGGKQPLSGAVRTVLNKARKTVLS
ncbi:hypothetical protein DRO66_09990 [Candidatus Bathyarchaeota archaeon]|nr:MAG: hypothetical protein DRO66_09990 [Candidatus Bathyarchaeota archaeon]